MFGLFLQGKHAEAVVAAAHTLRQLGVYLPQHAGNRHVLAAAARTRLALLGKRIEKLDDLPPMADERSITAMEIMASASISAASVNPRLLDADRAGDRQADAETRFPLPCRPWGMPSMGCCSAASPDRLTAAMRLGRSPCAWCRRSGIRNTASSSSISSMPTSATGRSISRPPSSLCAISPPRASSSIWLWPPGCTLFHLVHRRPGHRHERKSLCRKHAFARAFQEARPYSTATRWATSTTRTCLVGPTTPVSWLEKPTTSTHSCQSTSRRTTAPRSSTWPATSWPYVMCTRTTSRLRLRPSSLGNTAMAASARRWCRFSVSTISLAQLARYPSASRTEARRILRAVAGQSAKDAHLGALWASQLPAQIQSGRGRVGACQRRERQGQRML